MRLLFIAYHFPPIGGAGAQRSAKFVRYLPDFGIDPIVVGGPVGSGGRWDPEDTTQVAELSDHVPVYRPTNPAPSGRRQSRLRRYATIATAVDDWWQRQVWELGSLATREHHLDAIYVSLQPYESLEVALKLGRSLNLPVIADLRDPWALDEVRLYPTRAHRFREQRKMGRLLQECDLIVANTPEARSAIAKAFPPLGERLTTITNGYDLEDFQQTTSRRTDGRIRIVHTGYLHSSIAMSHEKNRTLKRVLGGSIWPIDLLSRSHYYLLDSVSRLRVEDPHLAARIDIVLAGVLSDEDERIIRNSPAADQVQTLGYLDHHAAIREMMNADMLFLPMHTIPQGHRARIVPGKTYEYLATGKPILAAVPEGDARELVVTSGAGVVVDPSDTRMMVRGIQTLSEGQSQTRQVGQGVQQFERRNLTEQLAERLHLL